MSILHLILPFDKSYEEDMSFIHWYGKPVLPGLPAGRYPTIDELVGAISQIAEYNAVFDSRLSYRWKVNITDANTGQYILDIEGELPEDGSKHFNALKAHGDRHPLERIIQLLPKSCGTYILSTSGEDADVITAAG